MGLLIVKLSSLNGISVKNTNLSVPRCECSTKRDCLPGHSCQDCECVKNPDVDATVCEPSDGDCFERKSAIYIIKSNIRGMPLIYLHLTCINQTSAF